MKDQQSSESPSCGKTGVSPGGEKRSKVKPQVPPRRNPPPVLSPESRGKGLALSESLKGKTGSILVTKHRWSVSNGKEHVATRTGAEPSRKEFSPQATSSSASSLCSSSSTPLPPEFESTPKGRIEGAEMSPRLCVTFDPHPTIMTSRSDGSPSVVTGKAGVKRFAIGSENPTRIPQGGEHFAPVSALKKANDNPLSIVEPAGGSKPDQQEPEDCHLNELFKQVDEVIAADPDLKQEINEDESEDPNAVPMIWVSKWVDYSDKYGLGYQLSDDSMGVLFNDFTKLLLLPDEENIHYIERNSKEHYHRLSDYPQSLYKKVTLLRYFRNYMNEHLLKAGAAMAPREGDELIRIPSLKTYFRTRSAIILHLTNGTLQINFFEDHTKIILCPLMGAVTYIDRKRNFRTFRLDGIKKFGCSSDLGNRLRYGRNMIQKLLQSAKSGSSSRSGASATHQPTQNL